MDTDDEVLAAASALRAVSPGSVGLVLGGGFCGLACAYELTCRGVGVVVVDGAAPGEAPASSAAAGMLDPLTVKGRLMWQGDAALASALQLILAADADACVQCGILHAPHSAKHGEQLRRAADVLIGEAAAGGGLVGCRWLCAEEAEAAAPEVHLPLGALLCPTGCVVDAPAYLRALWRLVQGAAARHGVGARWVVRTDPRRARWVGRWSAGFEHVIVAAGAGCTLLDETRHLPLELCRGQTLHYATAAGGGRTPSDARAAVVAPEVEAEEAAVVEEAVVEVEAVEEEAEKAAAVEEEAQAGRTGRVRMPPPSRLGVGVSGTVYVLPLPGRLVCGGTHESTDDAAQAEPPCAAAAAAALASSLCELCPGLTALGAPLCARAGVRALPPRTAEGALPLAGRAHTDRSNVWFVGGMGSRGLLYHALVAQWVVAAAVAGDAAGIPAQLRRCEWPRLVAERLARLSRLPAGPARSFAALDRPEEDIALAGGVEERTARG